MFNIENIIKKENKENSEQIENKIPFEINKLEEAQDFIKDLYDKGERPVVTVPKKYINFLKDGLRPHTTWVGVALIAATFGRETYKPENEERVEVHIDNILLEQIKPRFTGPNETFSGVVVLEPPIPAESISYNA